MAQQAQITSECYRAVGTHDLVWLLDEAKEKAVFEADATQKNLWNLRLHAMEDELLRRQHLQEEIEV